MTYQDTAKPATDLIAAGTFAAAWLDWLPIVAAGLSIVWLLIRIVDWVWEKFKPKE